METTPAASAIQQLADRLNDQATSGLQAIGAAFAEMANLLAERNGLDKGELCRRIAALPGEVDPAVNTEGFRLILGMIEGGIALQLHKREEGR